MKGGWGEERQPKYLGTQDLTTCAWHLARDGAEWDGAGQDGGYKQDLSTCVYFRCITGPFKPGHVLTLRARVLTMQQRLCEYTGGGMREA